mgnify:CR=1 FL=1
MSRRVDTISGEKAAVEKAAELAKEQKALREDIDSTRADLRPTIFLGGGTPSMLPLPLMLPAEAVHS